MPKTRRSEPPRAAVIVPRLLVSIRSVSEATIALAGDADLIDIKEPRGGSLGFAGSETVRAIARMVAAHADPPPLSVALGELRDWKPDAPVPVLPPNIVFAKIGLSGCRNHDGWRKNWLDVRDRFHRVADRAISWIAVHYVDPTGEGPPLAELLAVAQETDCAGLLLDTYDKSSGRLFDHVTDEVLRACRKSTRRAGLMLAAAGSVSRGDIPRLVAFDPDIIAVRGAACLGGDRAGLLDPWAIEHLRMAVDNSFKLSRMREMP